MVWVILRICEMALSALKKDKASGEMPSCMVGNALYTGRRASLRGAHSA